MRYVTPGKTSLYVIVICGGGSIKLWTRPLECAGISILCHVCIHIISSVNNTREVILEKRVSHALIPQSVHLRQYFCKSFFLFPQWKSIFKLKGSQKKLRVGNKKAWKNSVKISWLGGGGRKRKEIPNFLLRIFKTREGLNFSRILNSKWLLDPI